MENGWLYQPYTLRREKNVSTTILEIYYCQLNYHVTH